MKVLNQTTGLMETRVLSHDKYETIVKLAIEHTLEGWNYGKVYQLPDGQGHVMMFRVAPARIKINNNH